MSDRLVGWSLVALQALLLGTIVVLPGSDHWPTPLVVDVTGFGLVALGGAIALMAALRLGPSLTPTPIPTSAGVLITTGLFAYARHPIYTGVLVVRRGEVVLEG